MVIPAGTITNYYKISLLYELNIASEKKRLYENKYNLNFSQFEVKVNEAALENISEYGDYIEWKAYEKSFDELNEKILKIENEDIRIAS
jgi:hypothetical protein